MDHQCPICLEKLDYYTLRYPKMICNNCSNSDIKDPEGNLVSFSNIDITGGFISLHTINNNIIEKKEHICWVKNIKCFADESRWGGIVIQTVDK